MRELYIAVRRMSVAPAASRSSMILAACFLSTSADTATQSEASSGWTEGDFLPGLVEFGALSAGWRRTLSSSLGEEPPPLDARRGRSAPARA